MTQIQSQSGNLPIIAEILDLKVVLPEDRLDRLVTDSLEFMNFLLEVQNRLGITIPEARISELNTVGDLLKAIDELQVSN